MWRTLKFQSFPSSFRVRRSEYREVGIHFTISFAVLLRTIQFSIYSVRQRIEKYYPGCVLSYRVSENSFHEIETFRIYNYVKSIRQVIMPRFEKHR